MDVSFTVDEIEERGIEVAARPGRDNISVCTCTRFCLRCRSAQQLPSSTRNCKLVHEHTVCVAGRFFPKHFPMWKRFRTSPNMHSVS